MGHEIRMKRLSYDREREFVTAELIGEIGGRNVNVQVRFPFRAHDDRPGADLRTVALLEIQQILRSASTITLPDTSDQVERVASPATGQNGTKNWENEGGALQAQGTEILLFGAS